jgi:hypothetical protein
MHSPVPIGWQHLSIAFSISFAILMLKGDRMGGPRYVSSARRSMKFGPRWEDLPRPESVLGREWHLRDSVYLIKRPFGNG